MRKTPKSIMGMGAAILCAAILPTACNEGKKMENNPEATRTISETKEITAPSQIISLAEADSLYVNYTDRRAISISEMESQNQPDDAKPFQPTRFISFDVKVIKEYIAYVEQRAKKGGTEVDSLRIYLGNYGKTSKKFPFKNTVFVVPAAKVDGGYGGIYINGDGKAQLLRNYWGMSGGQEGEPRSEASLMPNTDTNFFQEDKESLILNDGYSSPPPPGDFN